MFRIVERRLRDYCRHAMTRRFDGDFDLYARARRGEIIFQRREGNHLLQRRRPGSRRRFSELRSVAVDRDRHA